MLGRPPQATPTVPGPGPQGPMTVVERRERCFAGRMEPAEAAAMEQVAQGLRRRFPHARPEEIARLLAEAHRSFDDRPVRHFVPLLIEREVTDALRAATGRRRHTPVPEQATATATATAEDELVDRPA